MFRGKFIVINACRREEEKSEISGPLLKTLEKQVQVKTKVSRKKEVIKIRAASETLENRKTTEEKSMKSKTGSLRKSVKLIKL